MYSNLGHMVLSSASQYLCQADSNEESSTTTAERLIFPCQESFPIYEARYQAVELAMKNVGRKLDEIFFF